MNYFILSILFCFLFVDFNSALDRKKDCKCRLLSDKKIIGGKKTNKLDYRWQVSISIKDKIKSDEERRSMPEEYKLNRHTCGAVILNERWILTAHCTMNAPQSMRIGMGTNDLIDMYDNNKYVDVEAVYIHPDFMMIDGEYTQSDIALLKTASKINFTDLIQPACVNFDKTDLYDGPLKLSGWGSINRIVTSPDSKKNVAGKISRYLKETINYDVTDKSKLCKHENAWQTICVANQKTKHLACKGDSGGPLHSTDSSGRTSVIGVVSFNEVKREDDGTVIFCNGKDTAYTRVSAFADFVTQYIGQDHC